LEHYLFFFGYPNISKEEDISGSISRLDKFTQEDSASKRDWIHENKLKIITIGAITSATESCKIGPREGRRVKSKVSSNFLVSCIRKRIIFYSHSSPGLIGFPLATMKLLVFLLKESMKPYRTIFLLIFFRPNDLQTV
jgi:hypothetical protein